MSGQATGPVGDVDVADEVAPRTTNPATPFRALVQRPVHGRQAGDSTDAPSRWQWIDDRQLRPGDRIVVPAERGGLDAYGWAPRELLPVPDVSEAAAFTASRSRREAALRLDPGLVWRLGLDDTTATMLANALLALTTTREDDEPARADEIDSAARLLAEHLPATPPPATGWAPDSWATLRAWLTSRRLRIVDVDDPTATWFGQSQPWLTLLSGPRPDMDTTLAPTPDGDDDEVAASSVAPAPVTLTDHHQAVRHRAGEIARALHLPAALRSVVEDAAGWHDLGKVEQRFQVMLHDGDPTAAALAVEPLAKSGMDPTDRMSWRRARRQSNLPAGARHEAWSAALIEDYLTQPDTAYPGDADLLLHLVASHHGYARPLARLVTDPDPHPIQALFDGRKVTVASDRTVSLDHPARFHRLNQRYGRWGLALLEAIVRCADTTVSGEGS
jgi:CRISPR-associated endonuclease/helicase Cas3